MPNQAEISVATTPSSTTFDVSTSRDTSPEALHGGAEFPPRLAVDQYGSDSEDEGDAEETDQLVAQRQTTAWTVTESTLPFLSDAARGGGGGRVVALDLLRGLIVMVMALDHARMLCQKPDALGHETWNHAPGYDGSVVLFVTRFVTHMCAAGFFFLMGVGIVYLHDGRRLRVSRAWGVRKVLRHFGVRSLVILALSLTVCNVALMVEIPNAEGGRIWVILTVIYALGVNMFLGAVLAVAGAEVDGWVRGYGWDWRASRLAAVVPGSTRGGGNSWWKGRLVDLAMLLLCVGIFARTEYVTPGPEVDEGTVSLYDALVYIPVTQGWFASVYPFLPWATFTVWGVVYGRWGRRIGRVRGAMVNVVLAVLLLGAFVLIRVGGEWGNGGFVAGEGEGGAEEGENPYLRSWFRFLAPMKYPPSLAYATMSMGINHGILAVMYLVPASVAGMRWRVGRLAWRGVCGPLLAFGRSALFFYIIHMFVYAGLGWGLGAVLPEGWYHPERYDVLYGTWVLGLVLMLPGCAWYGRFKHGKREDSYWRLF